MVILKIKGMNTMILMSLSLIATAPLLIGISFLQQKCVTKGIREKVML